MWREGERSKNIGEGEEQRQTHHEITGRAAFCTLLHESGGLGLALRFPIVAFLALQRSTELLRGL